MRLYVANVGGGMLQRQTAIASSLADRLSLLPAAAETIENGPASGASAVTSSSPVAGAGAIVPVGPVSMRRVARWRRTSSSILSTRDAGPIRVAVAERAALRHTWWSPTAMFDAAVRTCALVLERDGVDQPVTRSVGPTFEPTTSVPAGM